MQILLFSGSEPSVCFCFFVFYVELIFPFYFFFLPMTKIFLILDSQLCFITLHNTFLLLIKTCVNLKRVLWLFMCIRNNLQQLSHSLLAHESHILSKIIDHTQLIKVLKWEILSNQNTLFEDLLLQKLSC